MIRITYGPNQQGIREVEIQPQIIDNLSKVKESKKKLKPRKKVAPKKSGKPEQKKPMAPKRNEKKMPEKNEDNHTPPKEEKAAWQPKKGAPKATAPKKWVWMSKEAKPSISTSPGMDTPSSSKN
jgi:hypothetical protein